MIARPGLSPEAYRRITAFALAALAVIIVSGAAVRLTGSGLGCTDWPNCSQGELVADWEFHPLVEFANRVFTGVVSLAVIAAVAGSLRRVPRRKDLVWWSLGLVAGVIAQIVLGGLVVLFHLSPRLVIGHFLLSMVLVWNAVVLHHRAGEDPAHPAPVRAIGGRYLRWAVNGWFLLAMAVVVTGTVVTGAGPHGGDEAAERLPVAFRSAAQVHGSTVIAFVVSSLAIAWWLRSVKAVPGAQRSMARVLMIIAGQATVGYVQYFTKVPAALVAVHVVGATVLWIGVVQSRLVTLGVRA